MEKVRIGWMFLVWIKRDGILLEKKGICYVWREWNLHKHTYTRRGLVNQLIIGMIQYLFVFCFHSKISNLDSHNYLWKLFIHQSHKCSKILIRQFSKYKRLIFVVISFKQYFSKYNCNWRCKLISLLPKWE